MSMHQGIDLSRFRKVSSDGKTTTLRHARGHEVKIAHGALSDKMREHINGMPAYLAEGDEVPEQIPTPDPTPAPTPEEQQASMPEPASPPQEAPMPQQAQEEPAAAQPTDPAQAPVEEAEVQKQVAIPQPINAPELKAESVNFDQDVNAGHIHPKTLGDLFHKNEDGTERSTLGKIGTLFALMVGGAGAGLSHQPNAILEMMNKEIERDLEAQKTSVLNKQNFYKLNLEHQMNQAQISNLQKEGLLTDAQAKAATVDTQTKAYALARTQMNTAALHKMVSQVNKLPLGSPQRVAAEKQLAFMSQAIQSENFNIIDRAVASSALANVAFSPSGGNESGFQNQQGTLRMIGKGDIAESNESKHFPGLGQSSIPLTSNDRDQVTSGINFQQKMQRFIDWTKKHSGDLNPKDKAEGQAMAADLQGAYRMATHGGVYKEGEQGFISHIISSNPTAFFNEFRVLPKLEAIKKETGAGFDTFLKSKGFQGYKSEKGSGSGEQYKTVGGVKYKRGPNGEAIKVK